MTYTNKKLSQIEESARKRSKKLTHITNKNKFSVEDKIKFGLCQHFVQYLVTKDIPLKKLAEMVDAPVTRMSEITNYKFQKFTVDKLIKYLCKLAEHDNATRAYLRVFRMVAEMRIPTVKQSEKIYKDVERTLSL